MRSVRAGADHARIERGVQAVRRVRGAEEEHAQRVRCQYRTNGYYEREADDDWKSRNYENPRRARARTTCESTTSGITDDERNEALDDELHARKTWEFRWLCKRDYV